MAPTEAQVYLNGSFLPRSAATLDIEDRGVLFGDGVYEVIRYHAGRPLDLDLHLDRLRSSLVAIRLEPPAGLDRLGAITQQLMDRNALTDAKIYCQVTRGSAPRDHAFPVTAKPTLLVIAYPQPPLDPAAAVTALTAILTEDLRWCRCDIKSLMLLPNVLAKNQAVNAGADEAILHREGRVTEGTAASVFVVRRGALWTHPADQWILDGITRRTILELSRAAAIPVHPIAVTTQQLMSADEVLICGTTTPVAGVVKIDGRDIGDGAIGPVTARLHALLVDHILRACGSLPRRWHTSGGVSGA